MRVLFFTLLCAWFSLSHAQMYKCQMPDGRTAFQDKPCASDAKQGVIKTPAASSPSGGQGDPEGAYRAFHQAVVQSFNPPQWLTFYTAARRQQIDKDNQAGARWMASISRDEWPRSYQVTGKQPCGSAMCLTAAGTGKDLFGRPQEMAGTAEMVQEGGAWKIRDVNWRRR
jgi:hypothetical protein